jgi:hypothetical protein
VPMIANTISRSFPCGRRDLDPIQSSNRRAAKKLE